MIIAPIAVLPLTLPVAGPLLVFAENPAEKRKRGTIRDRPCARRGAAPRRAEAAFAAYLRTVDAKYEMSRARIGCPLDACRRHRDAAHRCDRATRAFALPPPAKFRRTYAAASREIGAPA